MIGWSHVVSKKRDTSASDPKDARLSVSFWILSSQRCLLESMVHMHEAD